MFKMKKKHINFPILSVFGKQGYFFTRISGSIAVTVPKVWFTGLSSSVLKLYGSLMKIGSSRSRATLMVT